MLFRSKRSSPLAHRFRNLLWPRSGFSRAWQYLFHRVGRMPGTSHRVAAGIASGVAVSFTPLLGLHFALAFLLTFLVRGSYLGAAVGTVVGNPWTFPFIWAMDFGLGCRMLGLDPADFPRFDPADVQGILAGVRAAFWPMLLGCLPIVLTAWGSSYLLARRLIDLYRRRRERPRRPPGVSATLRR